jgi:hypothetical protein
MKIVLPVKRHRAIRYARTLTKPIGAKNAKTQEYSDRESNPDLNSVNVVY